MTEYELFVTASREQVLNEASRLLESVLTPYYSLFKKTLFTGIGLVIAGVLLFNLNTLWPDITNLITPQYLLLVSLLAVSTGVALATLSIVRKRKIVVFDVQLYPVIATPYGDGSSAVLVDTLGGIGDDVELRVLRVDRAANSIRSLLGELASAFEVFHKSSVELPSLEEVLVAKTSGEETTWLFEERVQDYIVKMKELLSNIPVSYLSLKLLETPSEVKLFRELPTSSFLGCDNLSELVDKAASTVSENLETLRKEYEDLLNTVRTRIHSTVEFINTRFYREVEELAEQVVIALRRSLEKQYILLCPRCLVSKPGLAMYTPNFPILVGSPVPGRELELAYTCTSCGGTSEYMPRTPTEETLREIVKPVKMHKAEYLQSIAWSLFYINNRDVINGAISEARKLKELKYDEAYHFIEDFMKSFKEFLLPLYMQMIWYAKNVEVSSAVLEQVLSASEAGKSVCVKPTISTYTLDVIQKIRDLIGPGESIRKHLYELGEARKIWTNKVFNEVIIEKLAEAYKIVGKQDLAKRVLELYHKMEYEELSKLFEVRSHEQE